MNPHPPTDESNTRICEQCKQPYTPGPRTKETQKYGSTACRQEFWREMYAEARDIVRAARA